MKTAILALATLISAAVIAADEVYRLKYDASVDVVVNGKTTGKKTLKAGTLITRAEAPETPAPADAKPKAKLTVSRISPKAFIVTQTKEPCVFRATASLDTYFNGPFESKQNDYWSISISAESKGGVEHMDGYVLKSSKVAKRLFALLQDGDDHPVLVKVRLVPDDVCKELVTIEDFEPVSDEVSE